ncbi:S-layer homology domain-containing protein [Paenibacillus nasutitermitis]|uniref:SLH domain-containing protein n=1 Tax=Paenibacillus nasutitermitis TaxID=1652958 RepID=A0A916ZC04_9BACL|nr:S-layer homology domain-containing protein [Paenibacillus nasutitermitis]GGD84928.1 hypothetical protein GCM10010911_49150 [Paenibacillus nasutitermitis]
MKKIELTKKVVSLAVAGSLSLSMLGAVNVAAGTTDAATDISGHWAEQNIQQWISQGLIEGYADGSFQPNKSVSRAEFMALVNRAFGFAETGGVSFKDLKETDWSYSDIQKAVKAGYIAGFQDGTIHPNAPITRQEIALIIERLLDLTPSAADADVFKDASVIPSWSKGAIGAVQAGGIMEGYADNSFKPANKATRAEAVVILEHSLKVKPAPVIFDKAGTFGPETGSETIKGDVAISVPGVTLQNTIIEGNLTFTDGIGEGDAVLNHVTVKGTTFVQGGGANSIHFADSVLLTIIVDKAAGTVRIVAEGTTTVTSVLMKTGATLEESQLTGAGFTDVLVSDLLPGDAVVSLLGTFNEVGVSSTKARIDILSGDIKQVNIQEHAGENTIHLGNEAKIVNIILNAAIKVIGGGSIETVETSKEALANSTFETQPGKTVDKQGAAVTPPVPQQPTYSGPTQEQVDQQAADLVTAMIAALPTKADLKIADEAAIGAANTAFNALSAAQKALVSADNQNKLTNAAARIVELQADKSAADAVMALITALPDSTAVTLDEQASVTAAKNAWDALTASQKALVVNQDKLTQALAKIDALHTAVNDVKELIAALPAPAVITLDNQAAVTAAKNALDALSAAQKALVTNQDKLTQAIAKVDALTAVANDVTALIAALPEPSAVTLDDQAAVKAAKNALDTLAASQKALVTNQDKLTQAIAKVEALIVAANDVTALIAALPAPAVITLDNQPAVTAAKNALDALSAAQKALVTNQDKLTQAIAKVDALTAVANDVTALIAALPEPANLTLAHKNTVNDANSAYEALSASQKTLVTNWSKLTNALARIVGLENQQAADAVIALIGGLPVPSNLTLSDEPSVTVANNAFNALTATQKALVANQDKLNDAIARLAELKAGKAAADIVTALIAALPSPPSLSDEPSVTAADNAYNELTTAQQALVTNHGKLTVAIDKIAELKADKAAADIVAAQIAALPEVEAIILADEAAVTAARSAYNNLTSAQQVLVTNLGKLVQSEARITQLHLPQSLTSKEIADLNFEDIYATQARGESYTIADTNFQSHPVSFTVSDGNVVINVNLNWDIPLNGFTKGQVVGSAVESFIQQYYNDHHLDLGTRTLAAMGFGDTFYIMTFATGTQATVTLGGGYSALFASNTFSGMNDVIKSRSFTVSDGTQTVTIYQDRIYATMDALVLDINGQLEDSSLGVVAEKVDASHFRLKPSASNGPVLTIGGEDKELFFSEFQMN